MTKRKDFLKRFPKIGFCIAGILFLLLNGYSVLRCFGRLFAPVYNGLDAIPYFG